MLKAFARLLARFRHETRANIAIITALSAIPIFGMLGFALDYGTALSNKSKLDNAADEAALVAIKTVQAVMQGGGTFSSAQSQGITQAQAAFTASTGRLGFAAPPTIAPNITQVNQTISTSVQYTTAMTTNFTNMIGMKTIPISGSATASLSLTTYMNIYILVDVSQSMGIGTDSTNSTALFNRVQAYSNGIAYPTQGCVFGCHVISGSQPYTNEYLAHNVSPRITLRIDSAVTAIQNVISQAQSAAGGLGNIKIGLYSISLTPTSTTSYINTIAAMSNNYSSLSSTAGTIDLGASTSSGPGDTPYANSFQSFTTTILGSQGNGASASSPLNYVFLITDGVQDVYGASCQNSHCTQALDPSICTTIKGKATMGVIYTTYNPVYSQNNPANGYDGNYASLVLPFADQIAPNLKNCATSSAFYFEASDGTAIDTGMQQLLASTMQAARLTQ